MYRTGLPSKRHIPALSPFDCFACRWAQSQRSDRWKKSSTYKGLEPGDEKPLFPQRCRGEARFGDSENEHPASSQTDVYDASLTPLKSPRGYPMGDASPRELSINDTTKTGYQAGQQIQGAVFGAESRVSDGPCDECGRETDEVACLDVRARTLLEHCSHLLARPSTTSDQVRRIARAVFHSLRLE